MTQNRFRMSRSEVITAICRRRLKIGEYDQIYNWDDDALIINLKQIPFQTDDLLEEGRIDQYDPSQYYVNIPFYPEMIWVDLEENVDIRSSRIEADFIVSPDLEKQDIYCLYNREPTKKIELCSVYRNFDSVCLTSRKFSHTIIKGTPIGKIYFYEISEFKL